MRTWRQDRSSCGLNWPGWLICQRSETFYGDWGVQSDTSLNPLRKCVHQCKQRKFTPAPQISVYVGATSLGCRAALIVFPFYVCVIKWVTFFHMISEKQTNWFCCYWWSAGCVSWINHRDGFDERESSSVTSVLSHECVEAMYCHYCNDTLILWVWTVVQLQSACWNFLKSELSH